MSRSSYNSVNLDISPPGPLGKSKDFTRVYHEDRNESPEGVTMKVTVNGEGGAKFSKSAAEECLDWIYTSQSSIESANYGSNKQAVEECLKRESERAKVIDNYEENINQALKRASDEEASNVRTAYEKLKDVSVKKRNCLQTMLDVASLQQLCVSLSKKIDLKAVSLVDLGEKDINKFGENLFGFVSPSSQDCVFATRDNWDWNLNLVKCIETHMQNSSNYHQFFHEVEESSVWLQADLERIHKCHSMSPLRGDYADAERLLEEIQDTTRALRQWEAKTDFMWHKSLKVVPVYKRTTPLQDPTPARAIVDYKTNQFSIRNEEDLLILDNTDEQLWSVRNARGNEGSVPPLAVVIPGPTKEAIEAAVRMRLQLLAAWTNAIKVVGRRLLVLMLLVFKSHYNDDEFDMIKSTGLRDRQDLFRILDYIENTLKTHWSEHEGFHNLQERILMLRMILEQTDDASLRDPEKSKALVMQINTLENLMKKYQEMWRDWEKFKVALETSRSPELMLICDKWEQLKFVTRQSFARFWQNELPFTEEEKKLLGLHHLAIDGALNGSNGVDEHIEKSSALKTAAVMNGHGEDEMVEEGVDGFGEKTLNRGMSEGGEFGYATETKTAETEQLSSVEGEESKRFVIRSVLDQRTNKEISLDDAIIEGIIRPDEGNYCDLKTGDVIPIPVAMNAGLIAVEYTTTKRAKEKTSSVGIITVKTIRTPVQPYSIVSAKDTRNNAVLSKEQATEKGIINTQLGLFTNTNTGKEMLISDAAEQGFVELEYQGPKPEPEVEASTYAIRAVVDRRTNKTISFQEAVSRGIIDKDSGAYYDSSTGKTMYIGDAIMRGFLKARILDDPTSMDIDPDNKLVVDKTEKIRKKLISPLAALNALKAGVNNKDKNSNSFDEK